MLSTRDTPTGTLYDSFHQTSIRETAAVHLYGGLSRSRCNQLYLQPLSLGGTGTPLTEAQGPTSEPRSPLSCATVSGRGVPVPPYSAALEPQRVRSTSELSRAAKAARSSTVASTSRRSTIS